MNHDQRKMDDLDSAIKSHYESLELRDSKLEALYAMAEHAPGEPTRDPSNGDKSKRPWFHRRSFAIAATLLILAASSVQFMRPSLINDAELSQLVSQEIALNHNKGLAPEFTSIDYDTLSTLMDKLDFSPIQPSQANIADLRLIGARYCSIHGQLAVQIKLVDEKGELLTLYQTQLNPELSRLPEASYQVDNVSVRQWQESGLFFGLANNR